MVSTKVKNIIYSHGYSTIDITDIIYHSVASSRVVVVMRDNFVFNFKNFVEFIFFYNFIVDVVEEREC